jgi:putative PIN family toxin of toxin-antitoxin system
MAEGTAPVVIAVTLDTSFYIGALNSRGRGSRVLGMARAGEIRIDISDAILAETVRVLREKFAWDGNRLNEISQRLSQIANRVTPQESLNVVKEDPADNRILECAVAARSDYILTWDKDLLRLVEYDGIEILTPVQFVERGRVR